MHQVTSEQELQTILGERQGFLANKKESGGIFVVHDLRHLHGACNSNLGHSPKDYPKFFLKPHRILIHNGEMMVGIHADFADQDK